MSLLQGTGVYQKTDHWHPAFTPSGVTSDVSELAETDENVRILRLPDEVKPSGTVEVATRVAVAAFGIAGIIISTATLVSALLH